MTFIVSADVTVNVFPRTNPGQARFRPSYSLSLFLRPETLKEQTLNRGPSSVVKLLVGIGYTSRFTILWPRTKIRIEKDSLSVRHRSVLQHFYISKWKSRLVKLYNIV